MGFIAKQRTKSRVAAGTFPSNIPGEQWLPDGLLRMAAIVRAGASSIAAHGTLRSSSFRGGDFLGLGSGLRSADSTIWVEQVGYREWDIAIGMATVTGAALDWQIKLQAAGAEGPVSVAISTPTVLMKDGAQIHKEQYLELRELLTTGLMATAPPNLDGEVATGLVGLKTAPLSFASASITPCDEAFIITTGQSLASALERLRTRLHFRRSADGPTDDRWLIGLHGSDQPSWVDLTIEDHANSLALSEAEHGADGVALRFAVHLAHDDKNELNNMVATNHSKRFAGYALSLLRAGSEQAVISGGGLITDGLK
ncbi:MAG TPA: hypothetical protein VMW80_11435 [Candidatus Dormibacteraeota bacterium]|nr:hypothetical protein [Candidatus Dormibacteraeota bacterium]